MHESWRDDPRVREGRPQWPRRDDEGADRGEPVRCTRPREPWEEPYGVEPYPGATVLDDFDSTLEDDAATLRVLARYTVIRVLMLTAAGLLTGIKLRTERRIAAEHLSLLPISDWERMALQRLNDLCREPGLPGLLESVMVAAEAAGKRGHVHGEFALYRAAYHIGTVRREWSAAAQAAEGIARLARLDEARFSTRLWQKRARVLARRADRARAVLALVEHPETPPAG